MQVYKEKDKKRCEPESFVALSDKEITVSCGTTTIRYITGQDPFCHGNNADFDLKYVLDEWKL